jgi:hypothetical protein
MGATLTTVDAILKEVYEPGVNEQLNNDVVTLRRIERSSEGVTNEVGGKYVSFPIHTKRNSGVGARLEGDDLPTAGNQAYAGARVGLKYQYGRLQLTGQTIELADKNFQAFASAMQQEIDGLQSDLAVDLNRQVYGNGTGAIQRIITAGAAWPTESGNTDGLQDGMYVDLGTFSGDTFTRVVTGVEITALTETTVTFGTPESGTIAANQYIVRHDAGSLSGTLREWNGLGRMVAATGAIYNIDPSTTPIWKSTVDANGGTPRALTESLMITNTDAVRKLGSKVSVIFCNLGVRRAYFNLLVAARAFTNTKEFAGGFSGLTFTTDQGEIPVVVDVNAPRETMYGLTEKEIKVYRAGDWSFMDRDGSKWSRVANKDAYEATLYQYSDIGTHRRNAHFKIADITEG